MDKRRITKVEMWVPMFKELGEFMYND